MILPALGQLSQAARHICFRKEGSLCDSLCFLQHLNTVIRLGQQVVGLKSYVVLAFLACSGRHLLQTLLVAIRRVKQQQTIEVVALLKALFSKRELSLLQSNVTNFAPLLPIILLGCNILSGLHMVQLNRQVEFMVLVWSQLKGHLLALIRLEELGKFAIEALWDVFELLLGRSNIIVKDSALVVHH